MPHAATCLFGQCNRLASPLRLPFSFSSQPQQSQFFLVQLSHLARLLIQLQRTVTDAANFFHVMADLFKHLA